MLSDCLSSNGEKPEKHIRVLCVDDEPYILMTLKRFFRKDNYEVLLANSAESALDMLSQQAPVHIVLSDYRMPGLNGVEFLKQVNQRWPQTVGILLSGFADLGVGTSALELDFIYRHLPKPWSRTELRSAIEDAIAEKGLGSDLLKEC